MALVKDLDPDKVLALGSSDLPGLYRLDDLVFRLKDYHKVLTPIITGVEDLEKLKETIPSLGLNLKDYKTLPFFKASQGHAYFYPRDTARLITEDLDHYQGAKPGLLQKLFRGNSWT